MIPSSHNPNVPPPPGKFAAWTPVIYTQKYRGKDYPLPAIYIQASRQKTGWAVVLVGPYRERAIVPECDLTAAPPSASEGSAS